MVTRVLFEVLFAAVLLAVVPLDVLALEVRGRAGRPDGHDARGGGQRGRDGAADDHRAHAAGAPGAASTGLVLVHGGVLAGGGSGGWVRSRWSGPGGSAAAGSGQLAGGRERAAGSAAGRCSSSRRPRARPGRRPGRPGCASWCRGETCCCQWCRVSGWRCRCWPGSTAVVTPIATAAPAAPTAPAMRTPDVPRWCAGPGRRARWLPLVEHVLTVRLDLRGSCQRSDVPVWVGCPIQVGFRSQAETAMVLRPYGRGEWPVVGHVDVAGVRFELPDGRVLLDDVSFRVGEGAKVALVGANGAGQDHAAADHHRRPGSAGRRRDAVGRARRDAPDGRARLDERRRAVALGVAARGCGPPPPRSSGWSWR